MLSRPDKDWRGETGYVQDAVLKHYPDLSRHDVYLSGSPTMIHTAIPLVLENGMDEHRLHFDSFEFAKDHDQGN